MAVPKALGFATPNTAKPINAAATLSKRRLLPEAICVMALELKVKSSVVNAEVVLPASKSINNRVLNVNNCV